MNDSKVRIFISSPSDLEHERALVGEIIESLTQEYLPYFAIEPVLWEQEALTAAQSFQAGLVRPSECEIVLVMLWTRLGTPLADQPYGGMTGTEWEFVDAVDASARAGTPEVLVYRKIAPRLVDITNAEATATAVSDRDRLETFFHRHFYNEDGSFRRAFRQFDDDSVFRGLVETQLRKLLNRRIGAERRFAAGTSDWHGSPFRAGQPFEVADARVFTGRESETRELIARLDTLRGAAPGLLLVSGPSGVGKSSLVRAGLVPHLIRPFLFAGLASCRWCLVDLAADPDPIVALAKALFAPGMLGAALQGLGLDLDRLADLIGTEPRFAVEQIRAAIGHAEREMYKGGGDTDGGLHLAIILDPLDPLLDDDTDRVERLAELLARLAGQQGIWVIATLRSDRLARLSRLPTLAGLLDEQRWYRLAPPTPARIRQVMEIPARVAGIAYEERTGGAGVGLVEAMESDAGSSPHWPPLLQQTLEDLYAIAATRPEADGGQGRLFGVADYRAIGGLTGSMIRLADARWSTFPPVARAALPRLCRALISLEGESRSPPALRDGDLHTLVRDPACAVLIAGLVEARLVVVESVADAQRGRRRAPPSASLVAHFRSVLAQIGEEWRTRLGLAAKRDVLDVLAAVDADADQDAGAGNTRDGIDWSVYRPVARFAHPGLLARWQPLCDWLARLDNRRDLILHTQIARQAHLWMRTDHNSEHLLGEAGFAAAEAYAETHRTELEPLEQELLDHSWARLQFQRRRNRLTIGSTLALLLLFAAISLYAFWDARYEARISRQQGLLREADIALERGDPLRAVRLAWEAGRDLPQAAAQRLAHAIAGSHLLATVQPDAGRAGDWLAPAFSDDGQVLATFASGAGARLWSLDDGRYRPGRSLAAPDTKIRAIQIIAGGSEPRVLALGADGVWMLPAESEHPPDWSCGVEGRVDAVLDPAGQTLAVPHKTADGDEALCLLDLARPGAILWDRALPGESIRALAFSPNGDRIALASRSGRVLVLTRDSGEQTAVLPRDGVLDRSAFRLAFSPDGERIAVSSWDEQVHIFDRDGAEVATLGSVRRGDRMVRIHQSSVRAMAFSPDSSMLLVGDGSGQLVRWDLDAASAEVIGEQDLAIEGISITPGLDPRLGEHLALSLSQDGSVQLWRLETGKPLMALSHGTAISDAAFSTDGRRVMTASQKDGSARLWSVEPDSGLAARLPQDDHVRDIALAVLPAGDDGGGALLMATAGADGRIDLWRQAPGDHVPPIRERRLDGHTERVRQVVFAPSLRWLASAAADGTARVWDLASGEACRLDAASDPDACAGPGAGDCPSVDQVRFAPDERWLVTASRDKKLPVRLWDPLACRALPLPPSFEAIEGAARSLAVVGTESGAVLLAVGGRDGSLQVLRQEPSGAWSSICAIETHDGYIRALDFSPDRRWVAAAGRDGLASLIEIRDDGCGEPRYLDGDAGRLYDVAFAPDGKALVTAGFDAKAQVWSLDGTLAAQLIGHQNRVVSARFSPDGRWIMTSSRDGTIAIWPRPSGGRDRPLKPYLVLDADLGAVTGAVFDPAGTLIGAAYWDRAAVLWRLWSADPKPPEVLAEHWGEERSRLAVIAEADRYLRTLERVAPQAPADLGADGDDR